MVQTLLCRRANQGTQQDGRIATQFCGSAGNEHYFSVVLAVNGRGGQRDDLFLQQRLPGVAVAVRFGPDLFPKSMIPHNWCMPVMPYSSLAPSLSNPRTVLNDKNPLKDVPEHASL